MVVGEPEREKWKNELLYTGFLILLACLEQVTEYLSS